MSRPTILLVDSDPRNRRILEVSLRKAGFIVTTAENGEDALSKVEFEAPEIVLSETTLPGLDGFQLCKALKENSRWQDIPFVFLTDRRVVEDKVRGLELGCDEYLVKPIFIKELVVRLESLIHRKQRERLTDTRARTTFRGNLADMGVVDLLQALEVGRKSGEIRVTNAARTQTGHIFFRDGKLIDAELARMRGVNAVYRLLVWSEGRFEVNFGEIDRPARVEETTQTILMEGMRRVDEWGRCLEQIPDLEDVLICHTPPAIYLEQIPEEVLTVAGLFDGRRSLLEVVDESGIDDLIALRVISALHIAEILYHPTADEDPLAPEAACWLQLSLDEDEGDLSFFDSTPAPAPHEVGMDDNTPPVSPPSGDADTPARPSASLDELTPPVGPPASLSSDDVTPPVMEFAAGPLSQAPFPDAIGEDAWKEESEAEAEATLPDASKDAKEEQRTAADKLEQQETDDDDDDDDVIPDIRPSSRETRPLKKTPVADAAPPPGPIENTRSGEIEAGPASPKQESLPTGPSTEVTGVPGAEVERPKRRSHTTQEVQFPEIQRSRWPLVIIIALIVGGGVVVWWQSRHSAPKQATAPAMPRDAAAPARPDAAAAATPATQPIQPQKPDAGIRSRYAMLLTQAEEVLRRPQRWEAMTPKERKTIYRLLNLAVEENPNGWQALQELSLIELKKGHFKKALVTASRAIQVNPDAPYAHLVLGSVHDEHGETQLANSSYKRYLVLCPNCRYAKDVRLVLKARGVR